MKNGLIIDALGAKRYYLNDQLHREDGPATIYLSGAKFWYQHGKHHRLDGPAIEWINLPNEWWYKGQKIDCKSQKEFERLIKLLAFM